MAKKDIIYILKQSKFTTNFISYVEKKFPDNYKKSFITHIIFIIQKTY